MTKAYQGLYVCAVSYLRRGRQLGFTRGINVSAVSKTAAPTLTTVTTTTLVLHTHWPPATLSGTSCT